MADLDGRRQGAFVEPERTGAVLLGSGVNLTLFLQICPKSGLRPQNICSNRWIFGQAALTLQRF
jgi:hypothetical protein